MNTRSLAFLFLPLLALGGCTVVVGPTDTDVRVDAYWTINGGAANSKSCAAVGLDSVELVFYTSEAGGSGQQSVAYVDCASGGFLTNWQFAADFYYYEWIGYDSNGTITFQSDARTPLNATGGGTMYVDVDFVLDYTDESAFPAGTATAIYGEFDVMGQVPTADLCHYADINWVEIVLRDSAQKYEWTHDALSSYCEVGYIDSQTAILAQDDYYYLYRAYNDQNELVFESDVFPLIDSAVDPNTYYFTAQPVDFVPEAHLWVDMSYETSPGSNFYSNCLGAGADKTYFAWSLWDRNPNTDPANAVELYYNGTSDVLCPDQIQIDEATVDLLQPGYTYYLDIHSTASVGTKWGGLCAIAIDHAGYTSVSCDVDAT